METIKNMRSVTGTKNLAIIHLNHVRFHYLLMRLTLYIALTTSSL